MYDTHAHLDLLLQKLGGLPGGRDLNVEHITNSEIQQLQADTSHIKPLIADHELIIQPGISTQNFYLNYTLFQSFHNVVFMLGSHPDMVDDEFDIDTYLELQQKAVSFIETNNLIEKKQLVGIGEVGLDYFHIKTQIAQQKQRDFFQTQIDLAVSLELPLVIHCRDAFDDLFDILDKNTAIHNRFLIHCFTGGVAELAHVRKLGGLVAFGGVSTYNSAKNVQEAVVTVDNQGFVFETDLPFLSPIPKRGQFCLPNYIGHIAEHAAKLRNEEVNDIWNYTRKNVTTLFGI
jgi:TatD DNase family protein